MKITELIKSTPAFKASQQFDNEDETLRGNLTDKIASFGWTPIGRGYYAEVYQHPNYNYILKIFSSSNVLWIKYFHYALRNQDNPHVPKIRGKLVKLSPTAYAVRMEKLSPLTNDVVLKYIDPTILNNKKFKGWSPIELVFSDENIPFLDREWPQLSQLIQEVWEQIAHENGDFDGYQFMVRGDTIVWIDPI